MAWALKKPSLVQCSFRVTRDFWRPDPDATYRLLRASASVGLVLELREGRFSITELGKTLRADVPGSMRDFALALTAPGHWLPWAVWPTWHDLESGKHRRHLASNFSTTTTKI